MENNIEKFYEQMDNITVAKDKPLDSKIIHFEKVAAGIEIELPEQVLLSDKIVLNQGPTMYCVAYGTTAGVNESRNFLGFTPDKNPHTLLEAMKAANLMSDTDGAYVIDGPTTARKITWLQGFTQVNSIDEIKRALAFGMTIATGTNKVSWAATRKNNFIATKGSGGGHFINIVGYSDTKVLVGIDGREYTGYFIIENTWGEKRGDNGYYYLPYDYAMEVLFRTKVSLAVDKSATRKYVQEFMENLEKEIINNNITPVVEKYAYFNGEDLALRDEENIALFKVLQKALSETGYKPIYRTIIGSTPDRTNARLLIEISNARQYERQNPR